MQDFTDMEDASEWRGQTYLPTRDVRDLHKRALDGDKEALAILATWIKGNNKTITKTAQRYEAATKKLDAAESELRRAFNKWEKRRGQALRYRKEIERIEAIEELVLIKGGQP